MAEYRIQGETLTAIADAIRSKKTSPYTQVEYISTSTMLLKDGMWRSAYIDTGYKTTSEKFKIRITIALSSNEKGRWICGAETSSPYCLGLSGASGSYRVYVGKSAPLSVSIPINEVHTIELETFGDGTGQFVLDGTATEFSYSGSINKDNNYCIFDGHTGEIHSCQMYDNGVLVRDFVPAKDTDGNIGLYDRVNNVLHTNQYVTMDTVFTAGEEVGMVSSLIPTDEMASEILAIESGVELPTLTNPASASDIASGMEAIGANGEVITGTVEVNNESYYGELVSNMGTIFMVGYKTPKDLLYRKDTNIALAVTASEDFGTATKDQVLPTATFTSKAGVKRTGEMPVNELATPTISVNSNGQITATVTQPTGYVESATKSATAPLSTQAGYAITPNSTTQTAVAAGKYTTGAVTVNPIPSSYVQPSGTLDVTANGTYDVTSKASVSVNVSSGAETHRITDTGYAISPSKSGTVKVWGYGYKSSGTMSRTTYAFVGDGYYSGSSYTTPTKTSASFSISNGVLSGMPSGLTAVDVLVTIGI